MREKLGQRLLKNDVVSEEQLEKALESQRLHGGRLGHNLASLGFMSLEELDTFFNRHPKRPESVQSTGLDLAFISDLALKDVLYKGVFTLQELSDRIKLPVSIVDSAVDVLRRERLVEVMGAAGFSKESYKFKITEGGRKRASELLEVCRYVGPAPVHIDDYKEMVESQTIKNILVDDETLKEAFSSIVLQDSFLKRIGPAISSGRAIFLYGPPGNGKTTVAEIMGKALPGNIYIPYALIVGGQIINVFDPVNHIPVESDSGEKKESLDRRWILIKRPVIITGGELTLKMLDLEFNTISNFYEAPLQIKANNGLFIVDDFGRQQIPPQNLLNRWIVPLERRTEFLSLHTGMKFDIPFDILVVFSTNLEPKNLVDEAFLRRIRYKVKIDHPTEEEFEAIFKKVCEANSIEFSEEVLSYLVNNYYRKLGVKPNACHPRDLIDHIIDNAHHYRHAPRLTKEVIDAAWMNYFVEM
ncbi:MAG: ATPase [Thermodesulfobacteriota bacterium]